MSWLLLSKENYYKSLFTFFFPILFIFYKLYLCCIIFLIDLILNFCDYSMKFWYFISNVEFNWVYKGDIQIILNSFEKLKPIHPFLIESRVTISIRALNLLYRSNYLKRIQGFNQIQYFQWMSSFKQIL